MSDGEVRLIVVIEIHGTLLATRNVHLQASQSLLEFSFAHATLLGVADRFELAVSVVAVSLLSLGSSTMSIKRTL